ncbi:MAG: hypothetical protein ACTSSL_12295 [Candidatus Heimdallarchaeaceae archaeon]
MNEDEKILRKFANKLYEKNKMRYDAKFIKIYNELKNHFKVSQALKAGSLGKGTKIELYGDMDITFTIDNPEIQDEMEMRKLLEKKLKISFPNAKVNLKNKSVLVDFGGDLKIDVVYLEKSVFEKEKKQIKHIKSIENEIRDIIVLAKYGNYKKNIKTMKSYKIEFSAIYSQAKTFLARLKDTINNSGGGGKTNEIYEYILQKAKEVK